MIIFFDALPSKYDFYTAIIIRKEFRIEKMRK